MIDAVAALLAHVTDTLIDLEGRVYAAPPGLPVSPALDDASGRPLPALVLQAAGGLAPPPYPVITPRFLVTCYGPTAEAAMGVYRALWDACHDANGVPLGAQVVRDRWVLWSLRPDGEPSADVEPETGWSVTQGTFLARFDALTGATV